MEQKGFYSAENATAQQIAQVQEQIQQSECKKPYDKSISPRKKSQD